MTPKPHYNHQPPTYYRCDDVIVCATHRAASTSMLKALVGKPRVSQETALSLRSEGVESVMWLRDPLERWASAFDLFRRVRGYTLEQFLTQMIHEYNGHWAPQTLIHTLDDMFIPTIVYPFKDLHKTWNGHKLPSLGVWNVTRQRENYPQVEETMTQEQIERVHDYYSYDLQAFARLEQSEVGILLGRDL